MKLKDAIKQIDEKKARLIELREKSDLTADETKERGELVKQINELAEKADGLKAEEDAMSAALGYKTGNVTGGEGLKGGDGTDIDRGVTFNQDAKGIKVHASLDQFGALKSLEEDMDTGLSYKQIQLIHDEGYRKAFIDMARKGGVKLVSDRIHLKALSEGVDQNGGYLVPADMYGEIVRKNPHPTDLLDLVHTVTTGSDRLLVPKQVYTSGTDDSSGDIYTNAARIGWDGETNNPANSTDIAWGRQEITVHEGSIVFPAYRSLLQDVGFDLGAYLAEEARNSYNLGMTQVHTLGNGVGKPKGFLTEVGGTDQLPTVNVGNGVTADGLRDWVNKLPPQYSANARAMINKVGVFADWAKIKENSQAVVFLTGTTPQGLAGALTYSLLGVPLAWNPFMPDSGAANKVGVIADFRQMYMRVLRLGMTMAVRDIADEAQVKFVFRFREGGAIKQPRAGRVAVQS